MHKTSTLWSVSILASVVASAHATPSPRVPGIATLERGGYRMTPLASAPAIRAWEREAQPVLAACRSVPAPPSASTGVVKVEPLVKDRFFNKFFQGGGRLERLIGQQKGVPHAIILETGVWRLSQLQAALASTPGALQGKEGVYRLGLPLMIRHGASLVIGQSESLRLSRDRGAFLINQGTLHVRNARLESWDESTDAAAIILPEEAAGFQPFLLGWSGSLTVVQDSQVTGFGFGESLAHGLEFAVGPIGLAGFELPAPPRVYVVGSSLEGMYSGVRATGVPDLRVCDNHFRGSRYNAIHLESGSSGSVAGNRITETSGPYAVYFNKAPRDVWVIRNDISENHRSAMSIAGADNIVIAGNTIRQNFDGVFLQSSDRVLLAENRIVDNQRHGVTMRDVGRVRIQGDAIGPNRGVGVMALRGGPGGHGRASAAAISSSTGSRRQRIELLGVTLEGNHSSSLVVESPYSVIMDSTDVLYPDVRRRPVFRGVLNAFETDILYLMPRHKTLELSPTAPATAAE